MEITIKTLIELFLTTKSTEGRSDRTISWYREKLYPFERHLSSLSTVGEIQFDRALHSRKLRHRPCYR